MGLLVFVASRVGGIRELDAVVGQDRVYPVRYLLDQRLQESCCGEGGGPHVQSGEGELRGPIHGHEQVSLALLYTHLAEIHMEVADLVVLKASSTLPGGTGQLGDTIALQTERCSVERVSAGMDGFRAQNTSSSGSLVCTRKATTAASSSGVSVVLLRSVPSAGPPRRFSGATWRRSWG